MKKFENEKYTFIMGTREEALELGFGRKWKENEIAIESHYDTESKKTTFFAHEDLPVNSIHGFMVTYVATNVENTMSEEEIRNDMAEMIKFFLKSMVACEKAVQDLKGRNFVSLYAGKI